MISVVVTTINHPSYITNEIIKVGKEKGYNIVVVGDVNTPNTWDNISDITFIKYNTHKYTSNRYQIKMLGYEEAIKNNAELIIDTDDDNYPLPTWNIPPMYSNTKVLFTNNKFFNIYSVFTDKIIWPRGYPLKFLNEIKPNISMTDQISNIGIVQGLANNSPDTDAIYKFYNKENIFNFSNNTSFSIDYGIYTPLNSQNTIFKRELFPLLYLPISISDRYSDILRGYIAQSIMWKNGFRVFITEPTVIHYRNSHNIYNDFLKELQMYKDTISDIEVIENSIKNTSIVNNVYNVYESLIKNKTLKKEELLYLNRWLKNF